MALVVALLLHLQQHGCNVAFTYSSSVDAANALEQELVALGVHAKVTKAMLQALKKHKPW